jgi:hypothetical protein
MALAQQRLRPSIMDRLQNYIRATFLRGDLTTLFITCALMAIPALALSRVLNVPRSSAYWQIGLDSLVWVSIASVVFGFLLARSHYGEITALLLSSVYGLAVIGFIQYLGAPGDPIARLGAIASRLRGSFGGNQDSFVLVLFMSSLFWYLGHNTAWHVFRIDRVWRAVIPPGIVLLINGLYNFAGQNLDPYLIAYLFFALLLVIRSHLDAREYDWYINQIRYDARLRVWVLRAGAAIGIIALVIAWTLPTGSAEENQKRFQRFVNGDVFTAINKLASRLFTPLEGQNTTTADYYGRDELQLSGAIQLGDQLVMTVKATPGPRYYWKSRTFDMYTNGLWRSQDGQTFGSDQGQPLNIQLQAFAAGSRLPVSQTFTIVSGPSRLIYTAPQAAQISVPSEMEATFIDANARTLNVSVIRPKTTLENGSTYSALSYISTADADSLRRAAQRVNEAWLIPYRQLERNVASRTLNELLPRIVQGQITNYDKAKAIELWLRANITYNEAITTPPQGRDLVDWVIFDRKEAYCTYYATAMVVMLRQLGIPARLAAGFSQGVWDANSQTYFVRERDAHTWVEAYFPGAGWVEFEPTAAQQEIGRADPRSVRPTATATFTPTPLPTSTPLPSPSPEAQPQNPDNPTLVPPTETFAPTPTPSPTPAALVPVQNSPSLLTPILNFLLIASIVVGTGFFLFVGALWWFEYRGLDKLSPVGRAYARLGIYARLLRIFHPESATPLERGRKLTKEVPEQSKAIATITDMYIYERYGQPHPPTPQEEVRANRAWQAARAALLRQWRRRLFRRKV